MPMIHIVASGRPSVTEPPKTVRACRTERCPSATQSTHWMPTAAGRYARLTQELTFGFELRFK